MGLRCHQVVAKFRSLDPQDSARSYGTAHDATHYFRVLHNDYVSGSKVPVLRSQLTETFHEALIEKTAVGLNPSNLVIPPAEPRETIIFSPKKTSHRSSGRVVKTFKKTHGSGTVLVSPGGSVTCGPAASEAEEVPKQVVRSMLKGVFFDPTPVPVPGSD